jgi:predicted SnoaL-like aldol condensation-catalyzing enzyme
VSLSRRHDPTTYFILTFVHEAADPKDPTNKYTTSWFDMFRIEGGKIAEHWDPATKQ